MEFLEELAQPILTAGKDLLTGAVQGLLAQGVQKVVGDAPPRGLQSSLRKERSGQQGNSTFQNPRQWSTNQLFKPDGTAQHSSAFSNRAYGGKQDQGFYPTISRTQTSQTNPSLVQFNGAFNGTQSALTRPTLVNTSASNQLPDARMAKLLGDAAALQYNNVAVAPSVVTPSEALEVHDDTPKLLNNQEVLIPTPQQHQQVADSTAVSSNSLETVPLMPQQGNLSSMAAQMSAQNQAASTQQALLNQAGSHNLPGATRHFLRPPRFEPYAQSSMQRDTSENAPQTSYQGVVNNQVNAAGLQTGLISTTANKGMMNGGDQEHIASSVQRRMDEVRGINDIDTDGKVVGDDMPTMNGAPIPIKVVGDDPPTALATNSEFSAAAGASRASILFSIMSKFLIIEQMLLSVFNIRVGLPLKEFWRTIRAQIAGTSGVYKMAQQYLTSHLPGSSYQRYWKQVAVDYKKYETLTSNIFDTSYTTLKPQPVSVPLATNSTWQLLQPLMANTSVAEFSSALRVKIRGNDLDSLANAMAQNYNEVTVSAGYSFSAPLAKLIAYATMWRKVPRREEFSQDGIGFVGKIPTTTARVPLANKPGELFPFELEPGGERKFNIGYISYTVFVDLMMGRIVSEHDVFDPNLWDGDVAVVFLRAAEANDPFILGARVLSKFAFPIFGMVIDDCFENELFDDGSTTSTLPGKTQGMIPRIMMSGIAGPTGGILFVNLDSEVSSAPSPSVNFCDTDVPGTADLTPVQMTYDTMGAWMADAFYTHDRSNIFIQEIRNWESIFGNNSDRASAMRWNAENSTIYKPGMYLIQEPLTANTVYGYSYSGSPPVTGSPNNYLAGYYTTESYDTNKRKEGILMKWSPTGVIRVPSMITDGSKFRTDYDGGKSLIPSAYTLGAPNCGIDFLVCKGWLKPMEEYPTKHISDANQLELAIVEMSDVLGTAADLILQSQSVQIGEVILNKVYTPDAGANINLHLNNAVYPAVREMFKTGIQFPQQDVSHIAMDNIKVQYRAALNDFFFGIDAMTDVSNYAPWSRIPANVKSRYSDFFVYNDASIGLGNFPNCQTYLISPYTGKPDLFYAVESTKGHHLLARELSKLSLCGVGTLDKNLPSLTLLSVTTRSTKRCCLPLDCPGAWTSLQTVYSEFQPAGLIATNVAYPLGFIFPTHDITTGGDQIAVCLTAPRDAFLPNSRSTQLFMFADNNSSTSLVGARIMNNFNNAMVSRTNLSDVADSF